MNDKPWNMSCNDCESVDSCYPCPMENCSSHLDKQRIIRWTHSNCGGKLRFYENGKEKCQKCGKEDLFCNWSCGSYNDKNNSKSINSFRLRVIFQILVGLNDQVSTDFWFNIKMCLKKQKEDYPDKFI